MAAHIARICVPTDFSEAADHAVHYGAGLAQVHNAELYLLHVFEHSDSLVHHPDFTSSGEVARAYFNEMQIDALDEPAQHSDQHETIDKETHAFLRTLEEGVDSRWKEIEHQDSWWKGITVDRVVRYGRPDKKSAAMHVEP